MSYRDVLPLELALLGKDARDEDILQVDQRRLQGSFHKAVGHPCGKDVPVLKDFSKLSTMT